MDVIRHKPHRKLIPPSAWHCGRTTELTHPEYENIQAKQTFTNNPQAWLGVACSDWFCAYVG